MIILYIKTLTYSALNTASINLSESGGNYQQTARITLLNKHGNRFH